MDKIEEIRKKMIKKTKKKVTERFSSKEIGIIKASNLIEDLDSAFNLLAEQTIEWYSYHFPELSRMVPDGRTQLKLIYHLGNKKNFSQKNVLEHYENSQKAKKIAEAAKKSIGAELEKKELEEIQLLAANTLNLKDEKKFLTTFLDKKMNSLTPNFSGLCGPILGSKFLAKAGSLKKLAFMTSSSIQVLGSQKALFSHLRNGTKSPKHGFLYSHPLVKKVKPNLKGKVARSLAGKLAISVKEDFFGNKKIFEEQKRELEKKVQNLNAKKS